MSVAYSDLARVFRAESGRVLALVSDSLLAAPSEEEQQSIPDERLKLVFTCCHPALSEQARYWKETDWAQIKLLYRALYQHEPSPIVALNQAVALAHYGEYIKSLEYLLTLETQLKNYQPFYAACADNTAKLDLFEKSIHCYERAIQLSKNTSERNFLIHQKQLLQNSGHS